MDSYQQLEPDVLLDRVSTATPEELLQYAPTPIRRLLPPDPSSPSTKLTRALRSVLKQKYSHTPLSSVQKAILVEDFLDASLNPIYVEMPRVLYYVPSTASPTPDPSPMSSYIPRSAFPSPVARRLSRAHLEEVAARTYQAFFNVRPQHSQIAQIADTVHTTTLDRRRQVDNNYIYMGEGAVWSKQDQALIPLEESPTPMRALFTTSNPTSKVPRPPLPDHSHINAMKGLSKLYLDTYRKHGSFPKDDIPAPFLVWANDDPDIANDMMRALATPLFKYPPLGAYFLIGPSRSGKSTFANLLRTLYGADNTSSVNLSDLGDPHFAYDLASSFINVTDEEDKQITEFQAIYKTVADHGEITLPQFYSQEPMKIQADFTCYFPMNQMPEWEGTGAGACVKRTLALPFFADLSRYDSTTQDYEKETFNDLFFFYLIPKLIAISQYYSTHDFRLSTASTALQQEIQDNNDSSTVYREEFEQFFNGFQSWKTLHEDYVLWCRANDLRFVTLKQFKFAWMAYKKTTVRNGEGHLGVHVRLNPQPNHDYLTDQYQDPVTHSSIQKDHENGWSVLDIRVREASQPSK